MQRFIIERDVPGVGNYPPAQISDIIQKTRTALESGPRRVHWVQSFVTPDKVFSIYIAPDESTLRDFSKSSPLPQGTIHPVTSVVDLTSA